MKQEDINAIIQGFIVGLLILMFVRILHIERTVDTMAKTFEIEVK